jgi:pyochelin biosynthetic protein PchC
MAGPANDDDLWLRRYQAAPHASTRLVCLPHAGGSASFFYSVAKALAPSIDVLAVQYPGRQDRRLETPVSSITGLAEQVAVALRGWLDRPLAFFGHSMGAVVAFEVIRLLEAQEGVSMVGLFASGRRAPSRLRAEQVHLRDDDGIVAELRLLSGTDASLLGDSDVLRMILPAIRSDYTAVETYRCAPEPKLRCPVTVLVGDADVTTTLDEARAWSEHTTGPFDMRVFPGDHFYLTQHQDEILDLLRMRLRPFTSRLRTGAAQLLDDAG